MGCCSVDKDEESRQDLEALQRARDRETVIETDRHCTDVPYLLLFALCLLILFVCLAHMNSHADIYRLINGYDDCGNVCGKTNKKYSQWPCTGQDMRNKRYLMTFHDTKLDIVRKVCVINCTMVQKFDEIFYNCVEFLNKSAQDIYELEIMKQDRSIAVDLKRYFKGDKTPLEKIIDDFRLCWREVTLLLVFPIVLVSVVMALFICATEFTVWFLLIGFTLLLIGFALYMWILWLTTENVPSEHHSTKYENKSFSFLIAAIIFTSYNVVNFFMVITVRKKVPLVIQVIKEGVKPITAMPFLLFEPLITIALLTIACYLFIYFFLLTLSAGILTEQRPHILEYEIDWIIQFVSVFNPIMLFWIVEFIMGFKNLVVTGAVVRWYFSRDKTQLKNPNLSSVGTLLRYHLGNVAIGSLILSVVQIIHIILELLRSVVMKNSSYVDERCKCLTACFGFLLKYFSRQSYIQTALYGYPFCRAGKRSFNALSNNIYNMFGIISICDPIFTTATAFVILTPLLVSFYCLQNKDGLNHLWSLILFIGLFAWLVAHSFLTVFQITIDTIFMSFCEDCEINDGETRPYFMSNDLKNFIQETDKALLKESDENDRHISG